jgi:hypothetical protein
MRELIQRLSALDNDAASAMKMIAHFDALLAQGAGMTALVRGAAVLSGWPCGLHLPQHSISARVDAQGRSMKPQADPASILTWPHQFLEDGSDGVVWLERPVERAAPSDALMLERLAAGVHLTIERVSPLAITDDAAAIEIIASTSSLTARRKAVKRLHLREAAVVRVAAFRAADGIAPERSAAMSSELGPIRVTLVEDGHDLPSGPVGLGPRVAVLDAHQTTARAIAALSISSRINPVVDWEQWGLLAELAAAGVGARHPDVDRVAALAGEPLMMDTLEALAISETVRGAAALLGLHHSTVQQRQSRIEVMVDFRLGTPLGRARATIALAVHRARTVLGTDEPTVR